MLPYIKNNTFYYNDEPYIFLAGEIHNSSSSSLSYMTKQVWPNVRDLNLNTLLVPIAWETIEPEEGTFDFTLVKGLIEQARHESMHLVFLWFGLWKNAESFYAPKWVKRDTQTYFRARKHDSTQMNTVSPFCTAAVEKDQNAFANLMAYIKSIDEEEQTVLMVQVENEIGLLGTDRDYSQAANDVFSQQIPKEVSRLFEVQGTWEECFGDDVSEYLMCYAFASAVEKISAAGKAVYGLPLYGNAWLEQWPWEPGTYPSGGPIAKMFKFWKAFAPTLSFLAPDIYVPYVADIADEYAREDNTLFIPEVRKDAMSSTYALYTILEKHAIGYSPFGIEDIHQDPRLIQKPSMAVMMELNIDPTAFDIEGSVEKLRDAFGFVRNVQKLYLQYRHTEHIKNFIKRSQYHYGELLSFEKYRFKMNFAPNESGKPISGGGVIELTENKFLIYGMRTRIEIKPQRGCHNKVGILELTEVHLEDGKICNDRVLNGDEQMYFALGDKLSSFVMEVYQY